MLLFIQPFVIKASANKPASSYFDVKTDLTVLPSAASPTVHEKPRHGEFHVSGLDHYIDSRFSGELFRID
ncbi:hypothetical protein [Dyella humicola]|uniref:hypothetical protein n=1 Tax=Dyella humicola TaxID=2992126 RepID=UPI002255AB46|nr:hypothetical protein [Dyella humicola]